MLIKCRDIESSQRPALPRVQKSDQLMQIINILNTEILLEYLHHLQGYIYIGAIIAATMIGAKVTTDRVKQKQKQTNKQRKAAGKTSNK
jgi:hypothetical protein